MSPIWSWEGVRSLRVDIEKNQTLAKLGSPDFAGRGLAAGGWDAVNVIQPGGGSKATCHILMMYPIDC